MAMRDILFPECVITHMKAKSKEDALHQLYEVLLKNGKVKTSFYDAVLERERDYPTGLELEEYNAAIPHVVPAHVEHSAMGIAVLDTPVTFQRMDDDEATVDVNVIFNIALDVNGKQIDILQEIMAILADKDVMGQLVKADTPQDVMNILKKEGCFLMKKIMVCCGSSMITSTIAINKLKTAMANAGIDVKFIQCKFAEVQGKVKVERPDVIVPTGALKDSLTDSVPVVRGTCFVTGVGEKEAIDEIIKILRG